MCFIAFVAMYKSINPEFDIMSDDIDLKLTLQKVVSHAVLRMESVSEAKTKKCIFQEYREWLGPSVDDWVLALPNGWGKSDTNYY
tara:strand:- start:293 stop:547 length:255 start_codon:yes stop_codon:yes gene_type:complete